MKITVQSIGRFKEVMFQDFENADLCAQSGLLNDDEAHDLAQELRQVADRLSAPAVGDDSQILLPFAVAA